MPDLSVSGLATDMLGAVKASLEEISRRPRTLPSPIPALGASLVDIAKLVAENKVNQQQARSLLAIHRNTTQTVLLTIEGLGVIAVENAINAALDVIRTTVNRAVKFALL